MYYIDNYIMNILAFGFSISPTGYRTIQGFWLFKTRPDPISQRLMKTYAFPGYGNYRTMPLVLKSLHVVCNVKIMETYAFSCKYNHRIFDTLCVKKRAFAATPDFMFVWSDYIFAE